MSIELLQLLTRWNQPKNEKNIALEKENARSKRYRAYFCQNLLVDLFELSGEKTALNIIINLGKKRRKRAKI